MRMRVRTFLGMLLATALPAAAEEVSSGANVIRPAIWQGFYAGGHGDWRTLTSQYNYATDPNFTPSVKLSGHISAPFSSRPWYGALAGYNWQHGSFVYGVESDVTLAQTSPSTPGHDFWSLRGRAGVAAGPALFYGTAGIGTDAVNVNPVPANVSTAYTTTLRYFGYVIGAGVQLSLPANVSLRAEGLYYDSGKKTYKFDGATIGNAFYVPSTQELSHQRTLFRAAVIYRFQ